MLYKSEKPKNYILFSFVIVLILFFVLPSIACGGSVGSQRTEEVQNEEVQNEEVQNEEVQNAEEAAHRMCRTSARIELKLSPEEAEFPLITDSGVQVKTLSSNQWRVNAYVDHQNALGEMVRTNYICEIEHTGGISYELTNLEFVDEMTRPISHDIDHDYAQWVWNALYGCFKSYVFDTDETDTYISSNGTKIRILEQGYSSRHVKRLTEADIANGIVWQGVSQITIIYLDQDAGEWKDAKLFFGEYRYYDDGRVEQLDGFNNEWREYGAKCYMDVGNALILYR